MNLAFLIAHPPTPFYQWTTVDQDSPYKDRKPGKVKCRNCLEYKDRDQFRAGKYQRVRDCLECEKAKGVKPRKNAKVDKC